MAMKGSYVSLGPSTDFAIVRWNLARKRKDTSSIHTDLALCVLVDDIKERSLALRECYKIDCTRFGADESAQRIPICGDTGIASTSACNARPSA